MQKPYFVHPSAFVDGETEANGHVDPNLGAGTRIWHNAHVMAGARVGRDCVIGQNAFVGADVVLGDGCKLQNNVNVYDGVTLEQGVFCGPSMTFTNLSQPLPRAPISRRGAFQRTLVRRWASIGAGAVVVCGHELGEACFVAAGSTVVRDVPAYALVAGTPARVIGWVCRCGARLLLERGRATCTAYYTKNGKDVECGRSYSLVSPELLELTHDPHGGL